MSEIKVGDLVMVMRAFCPHFGKPGYVFTVLGIEAANNFEGCSQCGVANIRDGRPLAKADIGHGLGFYPLALLKRIPPLGELDDVKRDEEIHA